MKVLISVDMEGATGVTGRDDVRKDEKPYQRFRKLLTMDVNAAIEGALEAGATEILVTEGHGMARNILIEELNPKAQILSGLLPRQHDQIEGIDESFDAVFLVGFHSRAGTERGVIDHTGYSYIYNFRINGVLVGEAGINATIAGHYDVPIAMVSGDDTAAKEAKELLGDVETAIVKIGINRYTARCLTPKESHERIKQAAKRALERIDELKPYKVETPVTIEVEYTSTSAATLAARSGTRVIRTEPRKISYTSEDLLEGLRTIALSACLPTIEKLWQ